jgi:hypothetical protein
MGTYIYYTISDGKGDESTVRFNITDFDTGDVADLGQLILDFAPIVKALVDGGVARAGFAVDIPIPGLTWSAIGSATSDVQEKGLFSFVTAAAKVAHFTLPTLKETLMNSGSRTINTANAAVAALITAMEDGFESNSITFRFGDSNDSDFTLLKVAREAWGRYRRGA